MRDVNEEWLEGELLNFMDGLISENMGYGNGEYELKLRCSLRCVPHHMAILWVSVDRPSLHTGASLLFTSSHAWSASWNSKYWQRTFANNGPRGNEIIDVHSVTHLGKGCRHSWIIRNQRTRWEQHNFLRLSKWICFFSYERKKPYYRNLALLKLQLDGRFAADSLWLVFDLDIFILENLDQTATL